MGRNRANLKVTPEQLERFNELRDGTQIEFFETLLDSHEGDATDSSQRIESSEGQQLERIEELLRNVPERTANEVEGRLTRR